jgi:hypothetical protein
MTPIGAAQDHASAIRRGKHDDFGIAVAAFIGFTAKLRKRKIAMPARSFLLATGLANLSGSAAAELSPIVASGGRVLLRAGRACRRPTEVANRPMPRFLASI